MTTLAQINRMIRAAIRACLESNAPYRDFGDQGCLLYVGVSLNALQRLFGHRSLVQ
jgi:hypothetical protein